MNTNFYKTIYHYCFLSILSLLIFSSCHVKNDVEDESNEAETGAKEMMLRDLEMMKDPSTGTVPYERIQSAALYKNNFLANRSATALAGVEWQELGPNNQGGRTRAILVDAADATGKTVFVGSVGGGIWKTTDITVASPNWQPVNNFLANLAVTSLAQDPTNASIMYASTGEGYGNVDAIRGLGIFKSIDGGATWTQLSATNNASYQRCQRLLVNNSGVLFACTSTGLYRSTNAGTSFTRVLGTGLATGAISDFAYDVELSASGDMYASLSGTLHKSTNSGVSFGAAITLPIAADRIEIACAPSDNNVLYLLVENGNVVNGILQSINAGTSFVSKTEPADADTGIPVADFSRTQAWYDLTIVVDPNNANTMLVGGVDAFKSINGGDTWSQLSHWYGGFSYQYMHADQHYFIYAPGSSSQVYFGNDGGISSCSNMNTANPTILDKGNNYRTTQFYGCAIHPTAGTSHFLAGAQDNGSHRFTSGGLQGTVQVSGGDGAFCHIDQNEPQYQFTAYVYNNYYRSTNGGSSFNTVNNSDLGQFINPTDYDNVGNKMFAAYNADQYLVWTNPQTGNTFSPRNLTLLGGTKVTSVTVSPNTTDLVFFGAGNGRLVKVTNASAASPVSVRIDAGLPAAYLACIEVESGNDNHIVVTFSNYGVNSIYETTNGGTSWSSIEGNLPDMPIRWATFNPSNNDQLIVATELGVWSTDNINGASTVWGPSNSGLANVRVDMLQVRSSDGYIIASTHGRGLFGSDVFSPAAVSFQADKSIGYMGDSIQFVNTSIKDVSWNWNFGDGSTSTLESPKHKFTAAGKYNVTLQINSGALTLTKNSFIHILPNRGTPYVLGDGGNFESNLNDFGVSTINGTAWEQGNSAIAGKNGTNSGTRAWVTGLTATLYSSSSEAYLYTPNYNLSSAGTYNVNFRSKFRTETDFDGFRLEYSINKGGTWLPVGTTTAVNWYNFSNAAGGSSFPATEAFFAGDLSASFVQYSRDISFLAGQANVAFRFAFKTDNSVEDAGIAVDDWQVLGSPNVVLPVTLVSFNASAVSNDVRLRWNTLTEQNMHHYILEKSRDNVNFASFATVQAKNGASNSYEYIDLNANRNDGRGSKIYYRLQLVDNDAGKKYSKIEVITLSANGNFLVGPNPFTSYIQITGLATMQSAMLISSDGKVVAKTSKIVGDKWTLPGNIAAGVYSLVIRTNQEVITKQLIKL